MAEERLGPVVVEMPRGTRGLVASEPFPVHAGFLPQTLSAEGRPLGAFLCDAEPAAAGQEVLARIVGLVPAADEQRVLCVRRDSPVRRVQELSGPLRSALERFTAVPAERWGDAQAAAVLVDEARGRYAGAMS